MTNVKTESDGTVYSSSLNVVRKDGDSRNVLVGFVYTSGNYALRILGVDLVNESGDVVASLYNRQTAGSSGLGKYTLDMTGVAPGSYTLRYFVCVGTSESITNTNGLIGVKGLDAAAETGLTNYKAITALSELSNSKVYVLKSGRSISENTNHYLLYHEDATGNLSSTYGSGHSMEYSDATPNFQFALYSANGAYYMYNIAAGKYVGSATTNNAAIPLMNIPRNALSIKASNNGIYNWVLSVNNFTGALNVAETSGCHGLVNWNGGAGDLSDKGNIYEIIEVGDLASDIQTTLATQTAWIPQYTTIFNDVAAASDTYVGAMTTTAGAAVNSTCINFYYSPTQETYDAMVQAYNDAERVTLAAGEKFQIQCTSTDRGYLAYSTVDGKSSETNAYIAGAGGSWATKFPAIDAQGVYSEWAIFERDSKKYIYNVENKKFISPSGGLIAFDELGDAYVQINADTNSPTVHRLLFNNNNGTMLSLSPGYDGTAAVRTYGDANDGGVQFYLIKTGRSVETSTADLVEVKLHKGDLNTKLAKARLLGTGVGKYSYDGSGDATGTIRDAEALLTNADATHEDINNSISALDGIYADFSINKPEVGKLYRFRGYVSKKYMAPSAGTTTDTQMAMVANAELPATIFKLCEGVEVDGTTGYKLLSYNTGYYNNYTWGNGALAEAASSMSIREATSGNLGCYMLHTNYSSGTAGKWVYDSGNNNKVNRNQTYAAGNCDWTIEEVDWLPIPVSNTYGIGTFYSPVNIAITDTWYAKDSRLKFYIGSIENDYLVLTKLENNIPAETPVVIEYVSGSEYKNNCSYLKIAASAETVSGQDNDLRGTLETIDKPAGNIYTLQPATQDAQELTFCLYTGSTIKGCKAYLPAAKAVKGIRYNTGETTGIEGVATEKANKEIFDLSGRRVQNPTSGLYIINGQKVYVK
ncbi:MAG: hypothetical protein ACI3YA_05090 [Alloprevotella sp.]